MANAEGQDGTITFTSRTGREIAPITTLDQYEDWHEEAKHIGVSLQCAQDQQTLLKSYNNDDD
eukprot:2881200-Ditylum_brightwellii.AAC.1